MKIKSELKVECDLCGKEVILEFTEYQDEDTDTQMSFDGGGVFYKEGVYHNECIKKVYKEK